MGILNFFRGNNNTEVITDLKSKVTELEGAIQKSALNSSLVGVIGNNFITLGTDKDDYYKKNYMVYRSVNLLSESIASLPLKLYKGENELPIDFTFPNGFSMVRPNPQMSLNELLYTTCIYLFFRGEYINQIITNDGPFRLVPINPKKIERYGKSGAWKYNRKIIIQPEELIYSPLFDPDGGRGLSPIEVVQAELENDASASNYSTKFFDNFCKVGGTLTDKDGKATRADMEALVSQFNMAHQSKEKAYKTLGLPSGISYQEMAQTLKEMEFLESRKDIRDKILIVLGIHKSLVGVTDQVNRSVAEEAGRQLWSQTLKPAARRLQEEYNRQLFNRYFPGYRCEFDFSQVKELQESMESVLKQADEYRKLGYTTNEINDHFKLGMEEISDPIGNTRFVPNYLVPFDDMFIGDVDAKNYTTNEDKIISIIEKTDIQVKRNNNYINSYNRVQRTISKKMHGKFGRYFATQLGKVLSIVKGEKAEGIDINVLLSTIQNLLEKEKQTLLSLTKPLYADGSVEATKLALTTINSTSRVAANEAIVEAMTNKITGINNYTYKLIRNEVKLSVEAGETVAGLSKRITRVYKFNSARSKTIARTESANLVNRTTFATYDKEGVKKKQWGATMDAATRDTHAINGGMEPVDMNFVYPNGMSYPGDPVGGAGEVVNCRCCLIPVVV